MAREKVHWLHLRRLSEPFRVITDERSGADILLNVLDYCGDLAGVSEIVAASHPLVFTPALESAYFGTRAEVRTRLTSEEDAALALLAYIITNYANLVTGIQKNSERDRAVTILHNRASPQLVARILKLLMINLPLTASKQMKLNGFIVNNGEWLDYVAQSARK